MKPDTPQPSKTALKARSSQLQDLGEELLGLPPQQRHQLGLPERLLDALQMLGHITAHGGRRRQSQYVGKLMRKLDASQVAAIEQALQEQQHGSAAATLRLHALEDWRLSLLASDDAVTQWVHTYPQTDVQQLRALVRQARKDKAGTDTDTTQPHDAGAAPRKTRSWRQLYQFLGTLYDAAQATQPDAAP